MPLSSLHRKLVIGAAVTLVVGVTCAVGITLLRSSSGGIGRALMVAQGQIVTHDYSSASALPANYSPGWIPASTTNVSVEVPGKHSKIGHPVELDATLASSSTRFPSKCGVAEHSFPWDTWPNVDINATSQVKCGAWTETIVGGHLYAWRFSS